MRVLAAEQQVSFMLNAQNISNMAAYTDVSHLPRLLWINNIWQPDSGLSPILPTAIEFRNFIQQNMNSASPQALHMMAQTGLVSFGGAGFAEGANYSGLVSDIITKNGLAGYNNGWFVHPLLAGATLFLQQKMTMGQNPAQAQQQGGAFMLWFFPIFTIWICSTSNAAFSIYWLFANIYAVAQTFVLNLIYKKKDEKAKQGVIEEAT
jgi:membrane protein insertase Oxa1/YidC/SpoIIIJ